MADEKSEAALETKAPEKETKSDTKPESKKADEAKVDIEKVLKENEGLRQAQSTLTKSNATMQAELDAIKRGLSSITSTNEKEEEVDPLELVKKSQSEILEMRKELAVNKALADLKDDNGEAVPSEIKDKAMKLAKLQGLSAEEAVTELEMVVAELLELRDSSRTIKDKQPEASSKGLYTPKQGIKVYR